MAVQDLQGGRAASTFGIVAEDLSIATGSLIDQIVNIQAAFDWSQANRAPVFFSSGQYGFNGTLLIDSDMAIIGPPNGKYNCIFQQLSHSWPNCFFPRSLTTGIAALTIQNIAIDGNWDLRGAFGVGTPWDYDGSTLTQIGLMLACPITSLPGNNQGRFGDTFNYLHNIRVWNVAGTGITTTGQGEMVAQNLWTYHTANWGAEWGAVDCWVDTVTCAGSGKGGWFQSGGNARLSNFKCWFIGTNIRAGQEYGVGFEIGGSGTRAITGTNITVQDTWGPGFKTAGEGNRIEGGADSVSSLFQTFGLGSSAVPAAGEPVVLLNGAKFDTFILNQSDRNSLAIPAYLCNVSGSASTGCVVIFDPDEGSPAAPYNRTTPVIVAAGNISSKRVNFIKSRTGKVFLGQPTEAQLGDAAWAFNLPGFKSLGASHITSDTNKLFVSDGPGTTDPWYYNGVSTITPV